ncbi:hypothetical protein [Sphingobium sp. CAP-1]|uniref:hypothetical protein n=1 Tax=Sphingobium sp. CAP-1 TaxID=2676077 RepID=UPI0012BB24E4|nr:hypothetical protein [Sphingobium sp. CAP-1]QGP80954.1 hypothetical protein GL174_17955 [Sphingobium sp. CAP-1]
MKHAAILVTCLPVLLLAACGRTEPVGDMPDQDALAAAANAAAANAITNQQADAQEQTRDYVNAARGFSITFPESWVMDKGASTADGVVYADPGAGADMRVFWQKNDDDQTLQQIVEALHDSSEGVDGDFVGDDEYRGTANDGEGNIVSIRLLKQPDGSIVTATFVYPEQVRDQYQPVADTALKSLRLFTPKGEAQEAPVATGNTAN